MSIHVPEKHWWRPLGREELVWLTIAFVWCQLITFIMPWSHAYGKHNPPSETYRMSSDDYSAKTDEFIDKYSKGDYEDSGVPFVDVPDDVAEIYLIGRSYQWEPVLKLKKGKRYRMHLSSGDYEHGFSLQPMNMNLMALPGYDYIAKIVPEEGEYIIICNEFCGSGHHTMSGKIIVE